MIVHALIGHVINLLKQPEKYIFEGINSVQLTDESLRLESEKIYDTGQKMVVAKLCYSCNRLIHVAIASCQLL